MASERTFLAWIRTALGLLVAGVAVIHIVPDFSTIHIRSALGFALVALGCLAALGGYRRWVAVDRAMRTGSDMPGSAHLLIVTTVVTAVGVATLTAILVDLATS
ncbi:DUF202 domain-containing protein [Hoyosella rhizosphaerae]|nr:DUF202 domain-containing protein [Hoyosella rhizosphaerae]